MTDEKSFLEIIGKVLGCRPPELKDDLLSLGFDSFSAIKLSVALKDEFGVKVRPHKLLAESGLKSVFSLCKRKGSTDLNEPLVRLKEGEGESSLFLIHSASGNLNRYANLVSKLDYSGSIFGIESPGLNGKGELVKSIEEMADLYSTLIEEETREGSCNILGYSMGGFLALETANRIQYRGNQVSYVGLIDLRLDENPQLGLEESIAIFSSTILQIPKDSDTARNVNELPLAEKCELLLNEGQRSGRLPLAFRYEDLMRMINIYVHNSSLLVGYKPPLYEKKVYLYQASEDITTIKDNYFGAQWPEIAPTLEVTEVPGDHFSMMDLDKCEQMSSAISQHIHLASHHISS